MNKSILIASFCLMVASAQNAAVYSAPWQPPAGLTQQPIWPKGKIPSAQPVAGPEESLLPKKDELVGGKQYTYVNKVSNPTMTVFPPVGKNAGAAVVVFPGGGYEILATDLEGTEICEWLASKGITAVLLKYRVPGNNLRPKSGCYPKSPMALQDAQRTIRLVRSRAAELKINPKKIGVIGFSAGGHLVGATSTNFNKKIYKNIDAVDNISCRPDFGICVYPGHMLEHTKSDLELNPYVPVSKQTPPMFILQAQNDPVDDVKNSLALYIALQKAGVPAELHLYAQGGHAFGLRPTDKQITRWPELAEKWLASIGVLQN